MPVGVATLPLALSIRVAHLSDVHALSYDGVGPSAFFNKRLAGWVNLQLTRRDKHPTALFESLIADLNTQAVDQVLVSGDLTNLSLAPEFALARTILDRLHLGPAHVTVVPGNHDVYTLGARRARSFETALAPYALSDGQSDVAYPVERARGDLFILGLSTARPSPPPFADGVIGKAQLARARDALGRNADKFRIVVLHHPPFDNRMSFLRGLRDRRGLQSVLAEVGCELVVHGHEHRYLRSVVQGPRGPIPVIGVGSATYADPRADRSARYNIYSIDEGRLSAVEQRIFDPAQRAFVHGSDVKEVA